MEIIHLLIINVVCISLGIIGLWKLPIVGFFGVIMSLTVLFYEIIEVGFSDIGLRMFTIVTVVFCLVCAIGGYNRNG